MGIFRSKQEKPPESAPGSLEERIRALESRVRSLDDDFDELHDRFKAFQGRRAKREARAVEEASAPLSGADELNERIRAMYGFTRRQ